MGCNARKANNNKQLPIGSSRNPVFKEPVSVRKTKSMFDTEQLKTAKVFGS
jgi:hypothetical protein